MHLIDYLLLILIAAALLAACISLRKQKKNGNGCCGDCSSCGCPSCKKQSKN